MKYYVCTPSNINKSEHVDFAAFTVFLESPEQLFGPKLGKEHATAGTTVSRGNKTPNASHLIPLAKSEHREPLGLQYKIHRIFLGGQRCQAIVFAMTRLLGCESLHV